MDEQKTRAERMSQLIDDVKDIKKAILDDQYNPCGGLVSRLDKVEQKQREYDKMIYKQAGIIAGAGALLSFIITLLTLYLNAHI